MRASSEQFQRKPLRAHGLLADVPLHDVWAINLRGGGEGRTLEDFRAVFRYLRPEQISPVVGLLFRLRFTLGRWFGWDDESHTTPKSSYVHRLTGDDRARSLDEPGGVSGIMGAASRLVYAFAHEELHEIINFTGHHFLLMSMEPAPQGYTVHWAIYTKRTTWLTSSYMALIDPFGPGQRSTANRHHDTKGSRRWYPATGNLGTSFLRALGAQPLDERSSAS